MKGSRLPIIERSSALTPLRDQVEMMCALGPRNSGRIHAGRAGSHRAPARLELPVGIRPRPGALAGVDIQTGATPYSYERLQCLEANLPESARLKPNVLLVVTSMLSILLISFHIAGD